MTDSSLGWPWSLLSPFSQTIGKFINDPSTNWSHFFSPSVVFNANPNDAPVEAHVLSEVGSYGKQIGELIYMIDILKQHTKLPKLEGGDAKAVAAFDKLKKDAANAVADYRGKILPDQILDAFKTLKDQDAKGAATLLAELGRQ